MKVGAEEWSDKIFIKIESALIAHILSFVHIYLLFVLILMCLMLNVFCCYIVVVYFLRNTFQGIGFEN